MRQALTGHMDSRRRWAGAAAVALLLAGLWAVALGSGDARGADVSTDGCTPNCVILIQVDGLEPKDVTQASTPYLWTLAHPPAQGTPGVAGRAGWIWQAPRGVVSTGTAPATASLLSGAYPEKTGVPADDFYGRQNPQDPKPPHFRLSAGGFGDTPVEGAGLDVAEPIAALPIDNPIGLIRDTGSAGVFLGDPGLAKLVGVAGAPGSHGPNWFPTEGAAPPYTGDPRLCPVPRYPDRGTDVLPGGGGGSTPPPGYNPAACPANDMTTANKAVADLKLPENKSVGFNFIHFAELGAAKRLAGISRPSATDPSPAPVAPAQALSDTDAAIGSFVEQYVQNAQSAGSDKWTKTVLMVVGTHGYQTTPVANRVPNPAAASDPTQDLSDFVAGYAKPGVVEQGSLRLVPQGTMATIYYGLDGQGSPALRSQALEAIKHELEGSASPVAAACASRNPASPDCIDRVYYVDKTTPNTADTLDAAANHPSWHLDHQEGKTRTGASGDLVVTLRRGWAAGRAVGVPKQTGVTPGQPTTNPNTASAGGPQERAVAALVNGPGQLVRNLDTFSGSQAGVSQVKYYPVSSDHVNPSDADNPPSIPASPPCPDSQTDPGGLACANDPAKVGDDAATKGIEDPRTIGHEAQPVTVDFALTISALMRLPFESHPDQLQGRVLQEAFTKKLSPPCVSDCEPPPPPTCFDVAALTFNNQSAVVNLSCHDDQDAPLTYKVVSGPAHGTLGPVQNDTVTYTPAGGSSGTDSFTYEATSRNGTSEVATASVVVMEPPVIEVQRGFDFYGLVRKLKAMVVDSKDRSYATAPRGAVLSTIHLEADFGKPEAAVTLTFYRRITGATRGRNVVRLKAIARFDPFVVKRGHVTMRLKVPPQFKPNYVGVTVREVALNGTRRRLVGGAPCTRLKTLKPVPFRCTGPSGGAILAIGDAGHLHARKIGGPAPRRRR